MTISSKAVAASFVAASLCVGGVAAGATLRESRSARVRQSPVRLVRPERLPSPVGELVALRTIVDRRASEEQWVLTMVIDDEREAAEAAAAEAARHAQQEQQPVASHATSSASSHSDAWWHGVSICEQGGRNDEFFGYFSIMDGSSGGLDWATQVGMANDIIARHGDYAWAASCVDAGYRAAPGG